MLSQRVRRLLDAYPPIFIACHRQHVRSDEEGGYLSEHQASVLDHLEAERSITLCRLAEHMGIGRSAMSIMVARLHKRGFISRTRDQADGRQLQLRLTRTGAKIKQQNTILDPELVEQVFRLMRPQEIERALAGLEKLAENARVILRRRKRSHDK